MRENNLTLFELSEDTIEVDVEWNRSHRQRILVDGVRLKYCKVCDNWKSEDAFYNSYTETDNKARKCISCNKNEGIRRKDVHTVNAMLIAQGYKCAICDTDITNKPCIDHKHKSDIIRGLLCSNCNAGLGHLGDNPYVLRKAATYIEETT